MSVKCTRLGCTVHEIINITGYKSINKIHIFYIFLWILSEKLNDNESRGFPRISAMNRETLVSFYAFYYFFSTEHCN